MFKVQGDTMLVRLDDNLRALLHKVTEELRELLLLDEVEDVRRLYPTAYPDDEKLEAGYKEMVHDQLLMQRLDGLDKVQATLDDEEITIDTADHWMKTINECRLVLGNRLDVSEEDDRAIDEDDPDAQAKIIYSVLSHILEELTNARVRGMSGPNQ